MQAVEETDQVPSPGPATMPPVPLHLQNSQNRWVTKHDLCRNWIVSVQIIGCEIKVMVKASCVGGDERGRNMFLTRRRRDWMTLSY